MKRFPARRDSRLLQFVTDLSNLFQRLYFSIDLKFHPLIERM